MAADSLEANMAELTRKHKKPDQGIRVVTNGREHNCAVPAVP